MVTEKIKAVPIRKVSVKEQVIVQNLLKPPVTHKIKTVPVRKVSIVDHKTLQKLIPIIETGNLNEPVIYVSEVVLVNYREPVVIIEAPICKQEPPTVRSRSQGALVPQPARVVPILIYEEEKNGKYHDLSKSLNIERIVIVCPPRRDHMSGAHVSMVNVIREESEAGSSSIF